MAEARRLRARDLRGQGVGSGKSLLLPMRLEVYERKDTLGNEGVVQIDSIVPNVNDSNLANPDACSCQTM